MPIAGVLQPENKYCHLVAVVVATLTLDLGPLHLYQVLGTSDNFYSTRAIWKYYPITRANIFQKNQREEA